MAVRRLDHMELYRLAASAKRLGDLLRRRRRVQPVGTERDQQRPRRNAAECLRERSAAVLPRDIEICQRARGVEVGVGVEAPDERVGLVAQVVLDLELRFGDRVADVVGELQPPAELVAQRQLGQVGDVADHARHPQAGIGRTACAVVVAALPGRVAHDRGTRDRVPGQSLRVEGVRAGDRHEGIDLIRKQDRPLERLHPAERASGYRRKPLDAECGQERALGPYHVRNGDHGEVRPVRLSGGRVGRCGPRRPAAAAEQVRGHDEEAVSVECLARADHPVPPAEALAGRAVAIFGREPVARALCGSRLGEARRVGVAAERMAHQDDVVPPGREGTVGLVRHANRVQLPPAVEPHRLRQVEVTRFHRADRAGRKRRGWLCHGDYGNSAWTVYCQPSL